MELELWTLKLELHIILCHEIVSFWFFFPPSFCEKGQLAPRPYQDRLWGIFVPEAVMHQPLSEGTASCLIHHCLSLSPFPSALVFLFSWSQPSHQQHWTQNSTTQPSTALDSKFNGNWILKYLCLLNTVLCFYYNIKIKVIQDLVICSKKEKTKHMLIYFIFTFFNIISNCSHEINHNRTIEPSLTIYIKIGWQSTPDHFFYLSFIHGFSLALLFS